MIIDFLFDKIELIFGLVITVAGALYSKKKRKCAFIFFVIIAFYIFNFILAAYVNDREALKETESVHDPDIACLIEYPVKNKDGKYFRDTQNPVVVVSNNGPGDALSVTVKVKIYLYNIQKGNITVFVSQRIEGFDHAFSQDILPQFKDMRFPTNSVSGDHIIGIYVISITYYVGSEMKRFDFERRFFAEGEKIKDEDQFKNGERYHTIIQKMNNVDLSQWTGARGSMTCADDNVWFAEPENYFSVKKENDGKKLTITGLPEVQGESKKDGYPFLEINPHPFNANGLYIKAKIVDGYIEVKHQFVVTNIGDTAAMTTKDGVNILETIESGRTKYYHRTAQIHIKEGVKEPLENFIKCINEAEKAFETAFIIYYKPANDYEKLFSVKEYYSIGKRKAIQIPNFTGVKPQ